MDIYEKNLINKWLPIFDKYFPAIDLQVLNFCIDTESCIATNQIYIDFNKDIQKHELPIKEIINKLRLFHRTTNKEKVRYHFVSEILDNIYELNPSENVVSLRPFYSNFQNYELGMLEESFLLSKGEMSYYYSKFCS